MAPQGPVLHETVLEEHLLAHLDVGSGKYNSSCYIRVLLGARAASCAAGPSGKPAAADYDRHGTPVPWRTARQPRRPLRGDLPRPAFASWSVQGPPRAPVLARQTGAPGHTRSE